MSENKQPRSSGKLVNANHALPPVQVNCSDWPRATESRSTGKLVNTNHALAPVQVGTAASEQILLELHLTLATEALPEVTALRLAALVDRLDALEEALGGAGIVWEKDRSAGQNGHVTLVLSARDCFGAMERFKRLAEEINKTVSAFLNVTTTVATVFRIDGNGKRETHYEINHSSAA